MDPKPRGRGVALRKLAATMKLQSEFLIFLLESDVRLMAPHMVAMSDVDCDQS